MDIDTVLYKMDRGNAMDPDETIGKMESIKPCFCFAYIFKSAVPHTYRKVFTKTGRLKVNELTNNSTVLNVNASLA